MAITRPAAPAAPAPVPPVEPGVPATAWRPVLAVAGVAAAVLLALSGRYGWFGDELYFAGAGRHLSWGYADQPPLLPLIAGAADALFPGSVVAVRVPVIVLVAAGVVLTAQIAREMGGGRRAQTLAAAAVAIADVPFAHTLATPIVDAFFWTAVTWLVVRWTVRRRDSLLLWAAVATAAALQVKFLVPALWLGLVTGLLVSGPREMLRRPALWAGAVLVAVTLVPGVLWQAANGWPQLAMPGVIAAEQEVGGGRLAFLPVLLLPGIGVGMLLAGYGLWRLLRSPRLRAFRFLGWAVPVVVAVFVAADGKFQYVLGLLPVLVAAGAVEAVRHRSRGWRWATSWVAVAVSVLPVAAQAELTGLPLLPASMQSRPADDAGRRLVMQTLGQQGWPELVDGVGRAYRTLPPAERRTAVLLTSDYWQAGAIETLGAGLPRPYSPSRGYSYLGRPADGAGPVVAVGGRAEDLRRYFGDVRELAVVRTPDGIRTDTPVWVCREPRAGWAALWPAMRQMRVDFSG